MSDDKFSGRLLTAIFSVAAILILLGLWRLGLASKTPPTQPAKQAAAVVAPAQAEHWQLCWEKTPEHRGKTAIRRNCNSAVVERQDEILVVKYNFSGGQGIITAPKTPDGAYLGTWRDSTGSGNIFLRFISKYSAFGWQDDGDRTEKDPTSLVVK